MSHKPSHGYEDEPQEGEAGGENGDIGGLCADGKDDGDCVDDLQSKHEVFVSCLNTCGTVEHLFARRCQYTKTTFRQQLLCTAGKCKHMDMSEFASANSGLVEISRLRICFVNHFCSIAAEC